MTNRRKGRECALQILYQADIFARANKSSNEKSNTSDYLASLSAANISAAIENYFAHFDAPAEVSDHASSLVRGTQSNLAKIDTIIAENSPNWRLDRMAMVDRNVVRIATYELLFALDIPVNVILDEAIEIARRFGTERSSQFVNGLLDSVAKSIRKSI